MAPGDAMKWIEDHMSKVFPIGRMKG